MINAVIICIYIYIYDKWYLSISEIDVLASGVLYLVVDEFASVLVNFRNIKCGESLEIHGDDLPRSQIVMI